MPLPTVLYVAKPIVPPFHDGAKCLVRDLALHVAGVRPAVLTTREAPELSPRVEHVRVYPGAGGFAPALVDNARVLGELLAGRRRDLWHFVFAPNLASSTAGALARAVRRVPTVQTVASTPRSFDRVGRLLFGDRVVCLSEFTRGRLVAAGADRARLSVVPPAVPAAVAWSNDDLAATRDELGLPGDATLVVYPGDLELSTGAKRVAAAVGPVLARLPSAVVVYACRKKTAAADAAEAALRAELAAHGDRVRFVGEVRDLTRLLALARVVVFPVDDLYGKVDLPIALLEAMALGVPVVALDAGPLPELGAAWLTPLVDRGELADAVVALATDDARHAEAAARGRAAVAARHRPEVAAAAYDELYAGLLRR